MDTTTATTVARRLGGALEPVIGSVYFAPEAHAAYEAIGFAGSPNAGQGLEYPDGIAYATSRGSILGQVEPMVVAATFAVFRPRQIADAVAEGWKRTDAATIFAARDAGALGQLERVLGPDPDGAARIAELLGRAVDGLPAAVRPLAAGLMERPPPDHPLGAIFRRGDVLREFRGDAHNAAWAAAGLDATQIGLVTELYWGLPMRSYSRTRGWTGDEFDAAEQALRSDGWLDGDRLSTSGHERREAIEAATDQQMLPVLHRLGDAVEELIVGLEPWGAALRQAQGYPASGPHELAGAGRPDPTRSADDDPA